MQIDEFLELLDGVRPAGNGWIARCPSHEDREASLGVTEGDDSLLVRCHAGCDTGDVMNALGKSLSDLYFNSFNQAEPEAVYSYVDESDWEVFQTVRFPRKQFRQRHWQPGSGGEGGEWVWNLDGVTRVLYRLPEVIDAVRRGETVYICEGEKDVEALRAVGRTATCNPMGAGKWKPEYAQWFTGANVIIVSDRDEPGRAHAEIVKQSLQGVAVGLWVVQARQGKDASDHLAAGLAVEDFVPRREPVRRGIITAREMAEQALEDLELTEHDLPGYVLCEQVPLTFRQGRMYAIGAYTGDGKTCYALQGTRTLSEAGRRGGYFSLEMPERDLRNRLIGHRGIPLRLLEEPWKLKADPTAYALYQEAAREIEDWNLDIVFDSSIKAETVAEITRDREYEYVVIDHVHRFGWGSDRRALESQITKLTNLALEQNIMLLILCQLRRYQRGKDMEVYPRPGLQDFRETEVIGQEASMAISIWRQRDGQGLSYTGATQAIVLKNRHTTGREDAAGRIFMPTFDEVRQMFTGGGIVVENG